MQSRLRELIRFLTTDIWRIRLHALPRSRSLLIRNLRVIVLTVRDFRVDKCSLRASALTLYSILSVVPVVALGFGIAKGFGMERLLEERLRGLLQGQEQVAKQVIGFAHRLLKNTQGGLVAGVGVLVLLWTVIKVLGNIESSFNDVWGIRKGRSLGRKFTDYIAIILICPIVLVMSSTATVVLRTQIDVVFGAVSFLGYVGPVVYSLLNLVPFALVCAVLAFVYIFMPNTRVHWRSGILAGIVAGIALQLFQSLYISFQVGVSRANAIYGSFAALPLFLAWVQVSWLVVLFGAELSFAHQNVETYEFEPDCVGVSQSFKTLVALKVVHLTVQNFIAERNPATATEICHELGVPIRLVNDVVYELVGARVLSPVRGDGDRELAYQPALPVERLTVASVVQALAQRGSRDIPVTDSPALIRLEQSLAALRNSAEKSDGNVRLKDIQPIC